MAYRLGRNCKLYRNTGSYASPTWTVINSARDVTLNLEGETADVATRGNGYWGADATVKLKASLDFELIWDPSDAAFAAILTAFIGVSSIELLVLDGAVATSGSQGLRATFAISKFTRTETLNEAVKASVTAQPTLADNAPSWYTV